VKPRHGLLLGALVLLVISSVILLNITAPNPTGRRYSSTPPLTTGQGNANALGLDAERILAHDLRLPNNNDPGQKQCVCNAAIYATTPPTECTTCFVLSPAIPNYRLPDFVGAGFIAEAKNARQLLVSHDRDFQQIAAFAEAARAQSLALWVFVRVDTQVDSAYYDLFQGIKGGIVPYFAVPGYVDGWDQLAQIGLLIAALIILLVLVGGLIQSIKPAPRTPQGQVMQTVRKVDEAEDFMRRTRDRARSEIDNLHDDQNN
jgi:hypothetical protein